eukprot:675144-Pleurochrysis_carterae.AAC.8
MSRHQRLKNCAKMANMAGWKRACRWSHFGSVTNRACVFFASSMARMSLRLCCIGTVLSDVPWKMSIGKLSSGRISAVLKPNLNERQRSGIPIGIARSTCEERQRVW